MQKALLLYRYFITFGPQFTLSYLLQRFLFKRNIIELKFKGLKHNIFLRNRYSDFQVFTQIFLNHEYKIDPSMNPHTVVDCGANIGLATLFLLSYFPNCHYIVIEPEESNFEILKKNLGSYSNVELLKKAIWHTRTHMAIRDNGWGEAGFIVEECKRDEVNSVEAVSVQDIIQEFELNQIDLLKLDVEGSEEQVFSENYKLWLKKVNIIFVEIHENLKPGLTDKIRDIVCDEFLIRTSGEYHILTRKESC